MKRFGAVEWMMGIVVGLMLGQSIALFTRATDAPIVPPDIVLPHDAFDP